MNNLLRYKPQIIKTFYFINILIAIYIAIGIFFWYTKPEHILIFLQSGLNAGKAAIIIFVLNLLPGIAAKFKYQNPPILILASFRRQTGILMFMFVLVHYVFINLLPRLQTMDFTNVSTMEYYGLFAFFGLLAMFLTSNNFSVKKMGKNWKKLHKLVYIFMWFVLLHVGLQRFSFWTILMIATVTLEMMALLYVHLNKNNKQEVINET